MLSYDTNGVHKQSVLSTPHFYMKRHAKAAVSTNIILESKWNPHERLGVFTPFCEVVSVLLMTYSTDDLVFLLRRRYDAFYSTVDQIAAIAPSTRR